MERQQNGRNPARRILIAGIGNVLRGDDGFGPAVVHALEESHHLPPNVHAVELGIGGVNLLLELMDGYDVLIIIDAVDRNGSPGTLYLLEPEVPDVATFSPLEQRELAADMHQTVPDRALIMARAAGVLPSIIRFVGCQPSETEEFSTELSLSVQQTVPQAVQTILSLIPELEHAYG